MRRLLRIGHRTILSLIGKKSPYRPNLRDGLKTGRGPILFQKSQVGLRERASAWGGAEAVEEAGQQVDLALLTAHDLFGKPDHIRLVRNPQDFLGHVNARDVVGDHELAEEDVDVGPLGGAEFGPVARARPLEVNQDLHAFSLGPSLSLGAAVLVSCVPGPPSSQVRLARRHSWAEVPP